MGKGKLLNYSIILTFLSLNLNNLDSLEKVNKVCALARTKENVESSEIEVTRLQFRTNKKRKRQTRGKPKKLRLDSDSESGNAEATSDSEIETPTRPIFIPSESGMCDKFDC